jgi:hypothetical protein
MIELKTYEALGYIPDPAYLDRINSISDAAECDKAVVRLAGELVGEYALGMDVAVGVTVILAGLIRVATRAGYEAGIRDKGRQIVEANRN